MRYLKITFPIVTCLWLVLAFGQQSHAQTSAGQYPQAGEKGRYSKMTDPAELDVAALIKGGTDQTWDFGPLDVNEQVTTQIQEPPQTGPTFADWPEIYDRQVVNVATSGTNFKAGPYTFGDLILYHQIAIDSLPKGIRYVSGKFGIKSAFIPFRVPVRTSGDDYGFPLSMGKKFGGSLSAEYTQPEGNVRFVYNRKTEAEVDGSGTLFTHGDTLQTLRVKRTITHSAHLTSSLTKYEEVREQKEVHYEWYVEGKALPVARIVMDSKEPARAASIAYQDAERDLEKHALITNDAVVLGMLMLVLAFVFYSSSLKTGFWPKFYTYIPGLLLCYFLPALLNTFGIIDGENSKLYFVASRYLLPTSLVMLTLSIDLKGIKKLGPKAVTMFLAGTLGIVIGGPVAVLIVSTFSPETVGGEGADAIWRGLSTVAGSWIGGGANQTAMKEVFGTSDGVFSMMVAVDVIVANIWMGFLLYGAGVTKRIDKWLKADSSAIDEVRKGIEDYQAQVAKIPNLTELMILMAVGFGVTAASHLFADIITPFMQEHYPELKKFSLHSHFFWMIVFATTGGLLLSFTRARKMEGIGASKFGSLFLYVLVATIGMHMDIMAIFSNPMLFVVGIIWMLVHVTVQISVGKLIKAPFFMIAVGSQANVGGAASAPVVASAFHPSLAPVGVLLAVLGYALGTYAAYICGLLLQASAPPV